MGVTNINAIDQTDLEAIAHLHETGLTSKEIADAVVKSSMVPVYGVAALAENVVVTAGGTFNPVTGLTITLPSAGTYRVDSVIRSAIEAATGSVYITAKLYNTTTSEYILGTEVLINAVTSVAVNQQVTSAFGFVTVTEPTVLTVDAKIVGTGTGTIYSSTNGNTYLGYQKL